MKLRHLLPLLALSAAATLPAADAPPAAPAADFSAFKTADEFWAHFESLQKQPTEKAASREAARPDEVWTHDTQDLARR